MATAIATSLLIVVVNAAGFATHVGDITVDDRLAAAFALAAIARSLAAARIATRLPTGQLRRGLAYLVLAVAVFVVIQALLDPASGA
jgi:uncharacterized protein